MRIRVALILWTPSYCVSSIAKKKKERVGWGGGGGANISFIKLPPLYEFSSNLAKRSLLCPYSLHTKGHWVWKFIDLKTCKKCECQKCIFIFLIRPSLKTYQRDEC